MLGVYSYSDNYSGSDIDRNGNGENEIIVTVGNGLLDNDVDVIDVDSDIPKPGGEDEEYEYYYVYYDEDGNIVSKNDTPASLPVVKDKVQEIPLTPIQPVLNKNNIPSSNDEKPGDTPTIYAQIQNLDDHEDTKKGGTETEKDEEGLSIFGIPIPKIPLPILSFGLTPAFSHGLLPIGRKGDPSSTEEDVIRTKKRPVNTRYNGKGSKPTQQSAQDLTRGPDTILDPIWVEGVDNLASAAISGETYINKQDGNTYLSPEDAKNHFKQLMAQKKKSETLALYHSKQPQRPFENPTQGKKGYTKAYGYLRPENPIIPLKNTDAEGRPYTIPRRQTIKNGLPAIKFDHPVPSIHSISLQSQSQNVPISLSPELKRQNQLFPPSSTQEHKYVYVPEANQVFRDGGIKITDRYQTETGFVPIFNPDQGDPMYMTPATIVNKKPSAFPGIDATLKNGPNNIDKQFHAQLSSAETGINNNSTNHAREGMITAGNNLHNSNGVNLNVPYSSNGRYGPRDHYLLQQYYKKQHQATPIPLVLRSTKIPPRLTTPPPVVWGQSSLNLETIRKHLLGNEAYVYEDDYSSDEIDGEDEATENYLQSGAFRENSRSSTTVKHILDDVKLPKTTTTERLVPTLTIEEVLPTKTSSQISDEEELATTEIADNDIEYTSTEREHRTGASLLPTNEEQSENSIGKDEDEKEPEYEYEYYYEYYEDDQAANNTRIDEDYQDETEADQITENSEISEQVRNEDVVSLQNILNLIDGKAETTQQIASTVHSLMVEDVKERERDMMNNKVNRGQQQQQQINKPPFNSSPNRRIMPPKFRVTLPPPIRTSTYVPYENNYLDNQRSTVTVDYGINQGITKEDNLYNIRTERDGKTNMVKSQQGEHQMVRSKGDSGVSSLKDKLLSLQPKGRSSNNPSRLPTPDASPFHPDQMDPVSAVENRNDQNNDVKWYYSNYNSENLNPYISPSKANGAIGLTSSISIQKIIDSLSVFTASMVAQYLFLRIRI